MINDVFFRVFVSILRGQTKNAIDFVGEPQPNRVILEEIELILEKIERILGKIRCKSSDFGGHLGSCDAYCFYCFRPGLTFSIVV